VAADGEPLGEARTVALAVQAVLVHHAQGPVVVNFSATRAFDAVAAAAAVPLERTRTGEVHVTAAMRRNGAVAGGEHTGGIIIPGVHMCRDSYAGMAVLLERMALTGQSVRALDEALPRFYQQQMKITLAPDQAPQIMRRLRQAYAGHTCGHDDGLFVEWPDGWMHARRSNTEPVLRLIVEAATAEQAQARLAECCELAGIHGGQSNS